MIASITETVGVVADVATALALAVGAWQVVSALGAERRERLRQRAEDLRATLRRVLDAASVLRREIGLSNLRAIDATPFPIELTSDGLFLWAEFAQAAADAWLPSGSTAPPADAALARKRSPKEPFSVVATALAGHSRLQRIRDALDALEHLTAGLPGRLALLAEATTPLDELTTRFLDPAHLADALRRVADGTQPKAGESADELKTRFRDDFMGWNASMQVAFMPRLDAQLGFIEDVGRALLTLGDEELDRLSRELGPTVDRAQPDALETQLAGVELEDPVRSEVARALDRIRLREQQFEDHARSIVFGADDA